MVAETATTNTGTNGPFRQGLSYLLVCVSGVWVACLASRVVRKQDLPTAIGNEILLALYIILVVITVSALTPIPSFVTFGVAIALSFVGTYLFSFHIKLRNETGSEIRARFESPANTIGPVDVRGLGEKTVSFLCDEQGYGRLVLEDDLGRSVSLELAMARFRRRKHDLRIVDAGGGLALVLK
jgi:hypothetical protein